MAEEHSYLSGFNNDDVVKFNHFQLGQIRVIKTAIQQVINVHLNELIFESLRTQGLQISGKTTKGSLTSGGIECEILELGAKQWQKGKIKMRVTVEFEPDEPEPTDSPLDEIRNSINQ